MTPPNQSPATPSPSLPDDGATPKVDYSVPTPRTKAFILQIDDSSVDMGQVEAHSHDLECELIAATREIAAARRELRGYRMAYAGQKGKADGLETRETTLLTELAAAEKAKVEAERAWNRLQRECDLQMNEAHRVGELLKIATARVETAEAQLRIIGDMAVADWDDKTVGAVDAALKDSPFDQRKYAERVRSLFDRARRTETAEAQSFHAEELAKALEQIINGIPATDESGAMFVVHRDENGEETGVEHVDPLAVIQCAVGVAHAALTRYRSAQKENTL